MLLTPTYHVLRMYQVHQGAQSLDLTLDGGVCSGDADLARLSASASRDAQGTVNISLCNLDADEGASVTIDVRGWGDKLKVSGEVLTAPLMDSHNTFDKPDAVKPVALTGLKLGGSLLEITLPARSVSVIKVEKA
jgi:alpha-N-arabinofuranosidase